MSLDSEDLSAELHPTDATAATLVAAAEARTSRLDNSVRAFVEARVGVIMGAAEGDDHSVAARREELGAAALDIAEVAGAAGQATLGEVARGFSVLAIRAAEDGSWAAGLVREHLNALKTVRERSGQDPFDTDILLARLRAQRIRAGLPE